MNFGKTIFAQLVDFIPSASLPLATVERIIHEELHRLDNQDVFQVDKNIST